MSKSAALIARAEAFAPYAGYLPRLLTPVPGLSTPALDVFGAVRLSMGIYALSLTTLGTASALQELVGLWLVLFGGETFLAACTGTPPSWLLDPTLAIVFAAVHLLMTRTRLRACLPSRPNLLLELAVSPLDAIGRMLLLTRPILALLSPPSTQTFFARLPPTPSTLILVPFILAAPGAVVAFTGLNLFGTISVQTPAELLPWGWTAADAWLPVLVPVLFLSLIGPVKGWPAGVGLSEDAASVVCALFIWVCFVGRSLLSLRSSPQAKPIKAKKKDKKA